MHFSLVAVDFVVPQLILKLFHSDFFQAAAIGTVGVLSALGTDFQVVLVTIVERFLIFCCFLGHYRTLSVPNHSILKLF